MRVPPRNARLPHNAPTTSASVELIEAPAFSSSKTYQMACACGRPVIVSEASLGTSHHCVCGHTLTIPVSDELEIKQKSGEVKLLTPEEIKQLSPSKKSHKQQAVVVLGAVLIVLGLVLWIGNKTGFLPSIPLLGFLTFGLGGMIMAAGKAGTFGW